MDIKETVKDIKLMMGGSVVRLEIPDADIERLVLKSFKKIKPFITDRTFITVSPSRAIDLKSHKVLEVVRLFPASSVFGTGSQEIMFDFQAYSMVSKPDTSQSIIERYSATDPSLCLLYTSEAETVYWT